jgi:hypothetical protein
MTGKPIEHLRWRAHEGEARRLDGLGEIGSLGEEAIARMHGVGLRALGDLEDALDVEVDTDGIAALAQRVGLVGLESMERVAVLMGVDADRANPELRTGPVDSNRDLATIRDQQSTDFTRHGASLTRSITAVAPNEASRLLEAWPSPPRAASGPARG